MMYRSLPNPTRFVTLVVVALAMSGVVYATIPGSDGVINSCYKKSSPNQGTLRVVDKDKGQSCSTAETSLAWDQGAATSQIVQHADAETFLEPDPPPVSRATVSITVSHAGFVLVNAFTTITPLGIQGLAAARLRDVNTNDMSTLQATSYESAPVPMSLGWVFAASAGQHTYSLDVALTATVGGFANKTLTALYVPNGAVD